MHFLGCEHRTVHRMFINMKFNVFVCGGINASPLWTIQFFYMCFFFMVRFLSATTKRHVIYKLRFSRNVYDNLRYRGKLYLQLCLFFLKSWRKCQNYIMHIMEFLFLNVTFTFCYNQGSFFYFLFYLRRDQLTPLTSVSYSPLYWSLVATTRASLILIFLFFLLFFFGGDCICFLIVETWPFGVLFKIPLSANTRLIFDCAFIYLHLFLL